MGFSAWSGNSKVRTIIFAGGDGAKRLSMINNKPIGQSQALSSFLRAGAFEI
jgi:hypothetical protein